MYKQLRRLIRQSKALGNNLVHDTRAGIRNNSRRNLAIQGQDTSKQSLRIKAILEDHLEMQNEEREKVGLGPLHYVPGKTR